MCCYSTIPELISAPPKIEIIRSLYLSDLTYFTVNYLTRESVAVHTEYIACLSKEVIMAPSMLFSEGLQIWSQNHIQNLMEILLKFHNATVIQGFKAHNYCSS